MKMCRRCKQTFVSRLFYANKNLRDGLHSYCKKCVTAVNANWRKKNARKSRCYTIKSRYGVSEDEVLKLLAQQGYRCAICASDVAFEVSGHIDHDHKSGDVRGILCGSCNRAIGLLKDDYFVVSEAAAYLENYIERKGELEVPS